MVPLAPVAVVAVAVGWLLYLVWRSPSRDDLSTYGAFALPMAVIVVGWLAWAWRRGKSGQSTSAVGTEMAAGMASDRDPAGCFRVAEADPRRLGVHAAISVPGMSDEVLPEYVRGTSVQSNSPRRTAPTKVSHSVGVKLRMPPRGFLLSRTRITSSFRQAATSTQVPLCTPGNLYTS